MAKRTIQMLIDDLDGGEAEETVPFALDGVQYEIDLSNEHATELRAALAAYVEKGTKIGRVPNAGGRHQVSPTSGRRASGSAAGSNKEEVRRMREWFNALPEDARRDVYEKGDGAQIEYGRVAESIQEAYRKALADPTYQDSLESMGKPAPEPAPAPAVTPAKKAAAKAAPAKAAKPVPAAEFKAGDSGKKSSSTTLRPARRTSKATASK